MQSKEYKELIEKLNAHNKERMMYERAFKERLEKLDKSLTTSFDKPIEKIEKDMQFILRYIAEGLAEDKKLKFGKYNPLISEKLYIGDTRYGDNEKKLVYREFGKKLKHSFTFFDHSKYVIKSRFNDIVQMPEFDEFKKAVEEINTLAKEINKEYDDEFRPKIEEENRFNRYNYNTSRETQIRFVKEYKKPYLKIYEQCLSGDGFEERTIKNIDLTLKIEHNGDASSRITIKTTKDDNLQYNDNDFILVDEDARKEVSEVIKLYESYVIKNQEVVKENMQRVGKIMEKYGFGKYLTLRGI